MRRAALLVLLAACQRPSTDKGSPSETGDTGQPDDRVPTLVAADAEPHRAPAALLLVELSADDFATVEGTVAGDHEVDLDAPEDDTWAFRVQVLDASDAVLYEHTLPGPVQVRSFLQYYSDQTGYDILEVFPLLGRFPVLVPLLDDGVRARFQLRGDDGSFTNIGSYDLSDVDADDQGLSDSVVGSETLVDNGDPANRMDIALVSDGYTADQLEDWASDADEIASAILSEEPFLGLAPYVNIHRVDAVSDESGASYDCVDECRPRDTAFGTVFPLNWVNSLLGTDYDTRSLFQLQQWEVARAASAVPWDVVVVVSNTEKPGGMSVHYATVTTGLDHLGATSVHELGHAIGHLGDEYMGDACILGDRLPDNVTDTPEAPPWSDWIEDGTPLPTPDTRAYADTVGAFEGAMSCDTLYRPMETCLMEDSDQGEYCPVCAEQMVRSILGFADPADALDWSQDASGASFTIDAPLHLSVEVRAGDDLLWSGTSDETALIPSEDLAGRVGQTLTLTATLGSDLVLDDRGTLSETWSFSLADPG